jgi:hypothetical protein
MPAAVLFTPMALLLNPNAEPPVPLAWLAVPIAVPNAFACAAVACVASPPPTAVAKSPIAALSAPKAELSCPVAALPLPTAVALAPDALAWQLAPASRSVFATPPELQPALATVAMKLVQKMDATAQVIARSMLRMTLPNLVMSWHVAVAGGILAARRRRKFCNCALATHQPFG